MNTIESNKLIAEFMGITPRLESPDVYSYSDQPFFTVREYTAEAVMSAIAGYVKYHSSYDWLMPVVEKIEGLGHDVSILKNAVGLQWCGIGKFSSNNTKATGTTKIEAIYSAVVEFIKWYNKQNQI